MYQAIHRSERSGVKSTVIVSYFCLCLSSVYREGPRVMGSLLMGPRLGCFLICRGFKYKCVCVCLCVCV